MSNIEGKTVNMKPSASIVKAKRAAVYIRCSTDRQTETSVPAQKSAIERYAETNNITIQNIYVDSGKSGTSTKSRTKFKKMIADANEGLFDIVIVHKFDRFGRNAMDVLENYIILWKNGVELVSVEEPLPPDPFKLVVLTFYAVMAEHYINNLISEVKKGQKQAAKNGKANGMPPLGYDIDKNTGKYVINEKEAKIVKEIYDMYVKGTKQQDIADKLNKKGYKTKKGGKFTANSIGELVGNEKHYGMYVFNKASSADENGKRNSHKYKDKSEQMREENAVQAIVTKEIYDKAMERKKAKKRGSNSAKRNYLLSGIIKCGKCGSDMTGNARSGDKGAYRCQKKNGSKCDNSSIGQDIVEDFVLHLIKENLISNNNLAELTKKVKNFLEEKRSDYEETIKDMDKNISSLERKKRNLIDKISEDSQLSEDYEKKVKEIDEEIDALKKGKEEYIAENKMPVVDEQSVKRAIEKFTDRIKGISSETSKNFIKNYIKEVKLTPTDVVVTFMQPQP